MGNEGVIGGDWQVKSNDFMARGIDTLFASVRFYRDGWGPNICKDAISRTAAKFDPDYPGWFFYRRVRHGDCRFDRALEAYAIGGARALARSEKENGRKYISRANPSKPGWIAQAGRDALDYAIYGKYPAGLNERGAHFGVSPKTYQAIRDPMAAGMFIGVETWTAALHAEFMSLASREYRNGSQAD